MHVFSDVVWLVVFRSVVFNFCMTDNHMMENSKHPTNRIGECQWLETTNQHFWIENEMECLCWCIMLANKIAQWTHDYPSFIVNNGYLITANR